jgi:hypothetical protein
MMLDVRRGRSVAKGHVYPVVEIPEIAQRERYAVIQSVSRAVVMIESVLGLIPTAVTVYAQITNVGEILTAQMTSLTARARCVRKNLAVNVATKVSARLDRRATRGNVLTAVRGAVPIIAVHSMSLRAIRSVCPALRGRTAKNQSVV